MICGTARQSFDGVDPERCPATSSSAGLAWETLVGVFSKADCIPCKRGARDRAARSLQEYKTFACRRRCRMPVTAHTHLSAQEITLRRAFCALTGPVRTDASLCPSERHKDTSRDAETSAHFWSSNRRALSSSSSSLDASPTGCNESAEDAECERSRGVPWAISNSATLVPRVSTPVPHSACGGVCAPGAPSPTRSSSPAAVVVLPCRDPRCPRTAPTVRFTSSSMLSRAGSAIASAAFASPAAQQ